MSDIKTETSPSGDEIRMTKFRSPNYPVIGLRATLNRSAQLYKKYKRNWIPINLAHKEWEYKEHSGTGNQVVSALRAFGLIEIEGREKERRIRLTDLAYRIFTHPTSNTPDWFALLKKAALEPPLYAELWGKWGGDEFPDNDLIKHYLLHEREAGKFNPDTVDGFIDNFLDSLGFSRLLPDGTMDIPSEGESAGNEREQMVSVRVGDYVQWSPNGAHQFPDPLKVMGITDDGQFAFVEGGPTGLPMKELSIQNLAQEPELAKVEMRQPPVNPFFKSAPNSPSPLAATPQPGMVEVKAVLDEGPVILHWPDNLSRESVEEFEYWIGGLIHRARRKAGLPREDQK
jgi:hypothetical protein